MPARGPAVTAEPALKPNQPIQSKQAPRTLSTRLWGRKGSVGIARALADHERGDEAGHAGIDVDDGAAGEVENAERKEPAVGVPGPVGDRRIDEEAPQNREDDESWRTSCGRRRRR